MLADTFLNLPIETVGCGTLAPTYNPTLLAVLTLAEVERKIAFTVLDDPSVVEQLHQQQATRCENVVRGPQEAIEVGGFLDVRQHVADAQRKSEWFLIGQEPRCILRISENETDLAPALLDMPLRRVDHRH